ncbi:MAG: LytTR family transcriptional regulator [Eubacterium sp.]|nr:LytTR family transcriptional regulator [Eubacterium sp.]
MDHKQDKIRILVKQGSKVRLVTMQEVIYIESLGRKAVLHLESETIEYYAKISQLEEQLSPYFFRTHRAYLVNLHYVESYNRREALLKNADAVLISKYRFGDFQKAMLQITENISTKKREN